MAVSTGDMKVGIGMDMGIDGIPMAAQKLVPYV